jgi:hypothetical protein
MEEWIAAPVEGELPLDAQLLKFTNKFIMVVPLRSSFLVWFGPVTFGFHVTTFFTDPRCMIFNHASSITIFLLYTSAGKPVNHYF